MSKDKNYVKTDDVNVNHPSHYTHGKYETIDVIEDWTKDLKGIEAVDTANVIKYISRWKWKNGVQDLRKAAWYINHLIDAVEENSKSEDK